MAEFKDFSRHLSDFPVIFRQIKFSMTFQESTLNSSTFQACANSAVMWKPYFNEGVDLTVHPYTLFITFINHQIGVG